MQKSTYDIVIGNIYIKQLRLVLYKIFSKIDRLQNRIATNTIENTLYAE